MVTANYDGVIGTWRGTGVDVSRIEDALSRIWKEAGQHEAALGRQLPARASVLNLVVYVARDEDAAQAASTLARLTGQHPSRIICVVADPDAPASSLDASVSGQIDTAQPSGTPIAWEHITITAHGATSAHAPSIVVPLLIPDLPVYLWWIGDPPFGSELFTGMVDACDRLIVDSAFFAQPLRALKLLPALGTTMDADRGVSDFQWMRLTPWRHLLAQFYDREELRSYAHRIEHVRIGYGSSDDNASDPVQALLLAGWLASRLSWAPRPSGGRSRERVYLLEAERDGDTVTIELVPHSPDGAQEGDVVALALNATVDSLEALFKIDWLALDSTATTIMTVGDAPTLKQTVRMARRDEGELLHEELQVFHRDRVYEAALLAAVQLSERVTGEEES